MSLPSHCMHSLHLHMWSDNVVLYVQYMCVHVCLPAFVGVKDVSTWTVGSGRRGSNSPPDSPRGHQQPGGPLGNEAPHYDPSQGVPIGPGTEQDAEAAYHRMELLSQSIRNELQRDLHIHDSAVLPNFINLPQVCLHSLAFFGLLYCQGDQYYQILG